MRVLVIVAFLVLITYPSLATHTNDIPGATVTIPSSDGEWKTDDFEANLYFYDPHGLITCYYRIYHYENGQWVNTGGTEKDCSSAGNEYNWAVSVSVGDLATDKCRVEGQNKCKIVIWNTRMDWKAERYIGIDYKPPRTTISPGQDYYVWSANDITFTLSCSDSGSGCKENHYYITNQDGNTLVPHTVGSSYTITCPGGSECRRKVFYHSKDNVNKENSEIQQTYKIDKKSPTPNPAKVASVDFGISGVTITSETASDSGAGGIRYIFNGPNGNEESDYYIRGISNLQPNTYYCFHVQYKDKLENYGQSSSGACGYTDVAVPSFSLNPSDTSISMSINPNSPGDVQLNIIYYEDGNPNPLGEIDWTYSTTHMFDDLKPNKKYRFKVRAKGYNGEASDWREQTKYTLASPVEDLAIDPSLSLLEQGILAATNPVGFLKETLPLQPCSYSPVVLHQNGTLSYSLGVHGSVEGIPVNFCESGSYDACADLGINDTCNQLIDEPIETPCVPYDVKPNIEGGYILIFNRKYKMTSIGDEPNTINCESTSVPLPKYELCSGVGINPISGAVTLNMGSRIYYDGIKYTDCIEYTTPSPFPIETPCIPAYPELTSNNFKLKFYKYTINSPTNIENEYCYSLGVIQRDEVFKFEDGEMPPGWVTYLFNHPANFIGIGGANPHPVDYLFDKCRDGYNWIDYIARQLGKITNTPVGWNATKPGYNSNYALQSNAYRDLQTAVLHIPIIVDKPSKVQFMYKTQNVDKNNQYAYALFRFSINDDPPTTHGALHFGGSISPEWLERLFRLDKNVPPSTQWVLFDSTNYDQYRHMVNPGGILFPGYNTVTIELIRPQGDCGNDKFVWIDDFRIVPV